MSLNIPEFAVFQRIIKLQVTAALKNKQMLRRGQTGLKARILAWLWPLPRNIGLGLLRRP